MFRLKSGQLPVPVGQPVQLVIRYTHRGPALQPGAAIRIGYDVKDGAGLLQTDDPAAPNYLQVRSVAAVEFQTVSVGRVRSITHFPGTGMCGLMTIEVRVASGQLNAGDTIDILMGGQGVAGFVAGRFADSPLRFFYHTDPDGRFALRYLHPNAPNYRQHISADGSTYPDWRPCGVDIPLVPDEPARVDLVLPTVVRPGEHVPLRVVVYDRFCNHLKGYEDTIDLDARNPAGIDFRALTFSTGDVGSAVLLVTFTQPMSPTSVRFRLAGRGLCCTNPVCVDPRRTRILWGELHGHSCLSDGGPRNADFFFHYARHVRGLDFAALADHSFGLAVRGHWDALVKAVRDHSDEGSFVPILGYELMTDGRGHRNVYFPGTDGKIVMADYQRGCGGSFTGEAFAAYREIWDPGVARTPTPAETIGAFADTEFLWTAHHCGSIFPEERSLLRLYEACSEWGISDDVAEVNTSTTKLNDIFTQGLSPGLTGGSDDHTAKAGFIGPGVSVTPAHYASGLTAVFCDRRNRAGVYNALEAKQCYATTGARMLIDPQVDRHGTSLQVDLDLAGTAMLDRGWVYKNGRQVYHQFLGPEPHASLSWSDAAFAPTDTCHIRVRQMDGQMAWINPLPFADA